MKKNSITILACLFTASVFAQVAPAVGPGAQPQYQQAPPPPVPAVGPGAQPQPQYQQAPPPQQYQQPAYDENADVRTVNVSGMDKIVYIDNHGRHAVTFAMPPAGVNGPEWIAKWRKDKENGRSEEEGKLYGSFSYMGANGYPYQTRIVATATNDPMNPWMVRFQSRPVQERGNDRHYGDDNRRYDDDGYMDGRVIVLDWNNTPWYVDVYYSNERGIYFMFTPYQR